jgi:hypothetical protein
VKNRAVVVFAFIALLVSPSLAQDHPELDVLDQKIIRHFKQALPEWKHERIEPIVKGGNVLIEFWSFANQKVKVSILPHDSVEQAKEVFKNHERYSFNKEVLTGLGDEAVASGYASADVAFRRGKYTVYISGGVDVSLDPDARNLTESQRIERERSEARRLCRELAKHVADALDVP